MSNNDIEEDIKILENLKNKMDFNNINDLVLLLDLREQQAIENVLADIERLEKENLELKIVVSKLQKELNEENNKCAMFAIENKELEDNNFKLKTELESRRKEYQETYKDVREEIKELKDKAKKYDSLVEKIKEKLKKLKEEYEETIEKNDIKAFILKCQIEAIKEIIQSIKQTH